MEVYGLGATMNALVRGLETEQMRQAFAQCKSLWVHDGKIGRVR